MAQPLPYERDFDFEGFQSGHPSTPLPGDKIDLELDQVAETTNQIRDRIARLQDDDLALKRKSVGYDQLKDELNGFGFNPPSEWTTATGYAVRDTVFHDAGFYRCVTAHTSGTFATDFGAGKWDLVADFTAATTDAQTAATAAEAAQTAAETAETNAVAAKDQAVTSAANAATSASNAALSETNAASSASSAVSSASAASTSAANAASSASDAAASAVAAASSASDAAASATAAAASAASLDAANIVYKTDTDASGYGFVSNDTTMAGDSATEVPTQHSAKAYVDKLAPAITANTMLVDNAAGDARESKTFAEVRTALKLLAWDELPYVPAWENGVPGDSSDQSTALQAIVDALPTAGGTIVLRGDVVTNGLDLSTGSRHNVRFLGERGSGNGTGSAQNSQLRTTSLGSGDIIQLKKTYNVSFEDLLIAISDSSFTGKMLAYGSTSPVSGDDAALMSIVNCLISSQAAGAKALWLYGATQGKFDRVTFSGRGALVQMQNAAGVGFCNVHEFSQCNWKPTGGEYPMQGSGEGIKLVGGNVQASSGDGIGRFWQTDDNQEFRGITLLGTTFYDVAAAGGIWNYFKNGTGLNLIGVNAGGSSAGGNYFASIGGGATGTSGNVKGLRGLTVLGNTFRYFTAAFTCAGSAANYNQAQDGVMGGNQCYGTVAGNPTLLAGNLSAAAKIFFLPNNINAAPFAYGSLVCQYDLPGYANRAAAVSAGLQTGMMFYETTSGERNVRIV